MLVSRRARVHYGLADSLFALEGNVILADFRAAHKVAAAINRVRRVAGEADRSVAASDISAAGLMHELMHALMAAYRRTVNNEVWGQALAELEIDVGVEEVEGVLETFVEAFPTRAVREGEISALDYLEGSSDGRRHREIVLEEVLLLWLANANPALESLGDLFDDSELSRNTAYLELMNQLQTFFAGRPGLAQGKTSLINMLRGPALAHPHSLAKQLEHIRSSWGIWLQDLVLRLLGGLDFLAEEHRPVFPPGPGPSEAPTYPPIEGEPPEAFSADLDWMPRVVMLSKNTHVWLAQLAEEYDREILTLDQVPDEELDRLAGRGITSLWLIGVWQRSRASKKIKRWMGDSEAVASAYSLYDYVVAADLGGQEALDELKGRAWQRGIRMATDMVPNHVGIDGRWLVEHPDWFIGLPDCPYPSYQFGCADLCEDERVSVHIEDGYWDHSDAAVVFKRTDSWTGETRYIYHGNDGTSMPWNDTAQLDYRKAEVREAVIQTILHVARISPIIRFDAAMTLTRKNFQRLWFPEPGTGGDIPSRSGFAMSREEFDEAMPEEFWREVVDRVAVEAPDTLLLAEAFWMLEGFFVRSLGMHRVYNSAFMNMLRDEKNDEYRTLIRNTLEYDPRILSRYVNFMSNPDERTAVDQFGSDDKYFGVCTLLATMPGLPMIGHGQVEGYAEKYGMEFHRPRWNELADQGLLDRHRRQVFPLLRQRFLFAGVEHFRLYDMVAEHGAVIEDVFAYSNEAEGRRSLVIFNNLFAETSGWIYRAVPTRVDPGGDDARLHHGNLGECLRIPREDGLFVAYRDQVSGLEYLRSAIELCDRGLFCDLKAYTHHVLLDFREIRDEEGRWATLAHELKGRGTPSLEEALLEMKLAPVLKPWTAVLRRLAAGEQQGQEFEQDLLLFVMACRRFAGVPGPAAETVSEILSRIDFWFADESALAREDDDWFSRVHEFANETPLQAMILGAWAAARALSDLEGEPPVSAPERFADWRLGNAVASIARGLGVGDIEAVRSGRAVALLLETEGWAESKVAGTVPLSLGKRLVASPGGVDFLGVNEYDGRLWFRQEGFEGALPWLEVSVLEAIAGAPERAPEIRKTVAGSINALRAAAESSGFDVNLFLEGLVAGDLED